MMRGLILAGAVLVAGAAQAATIATDHGHIVLQGKAITAGSQDSDPVLAPDGKHVVFTRTVGKPLTSCSASGAETDNVELWVVNAGGATVGSPVFDVLMNWPF